MLKIILVLIVVAIVGVLGYAATRPDTFRVERSVTIKAPPEKIFPLIDDLQAWRTWSPYEKKDPAMQRTFGSITQGRGASYAWNGNKEIGQGSMEITESAPSSRIAMNLDFIAPFEAHNKVEFALAPAGDSTTVTWTLFGPSPFISKLMGVFFDMDKMVGTDFEAGLASLKGIAES